MEVIGRKVLKLTVQADTDTGRNAARNYFVNFLLEVIFFFIYLNKQNLISVVTQVAHYKWPNKTSQVAHYKSSQVAPYKANHPKNLPWSKKKSGKVGFNEGERVRLLPL